MDYQKRQVSLAAAKYNPSLSIGFKETWGTPVSYTHLDVYKRQQIYFTAENRDCYSLYRMNPADGKILQLEVSEDLVNSFSDVYKRQAIK